MATRLLVSEDQCEGRFVFGRKSQPPVKKVTKEVPAKLLKTVGGGESDNSKNELQTVLARAGHGVPIYKTSQLKNNHFRSTVIFNGLNFVGQPCRSKKLAEKDAAAQALQWLKGESFSSSRAVDHASVLLKPSKGRAPVYVGKWI